MGGALHRQDDLAGWRSASPARRGARAGLPQSALPGVLTLLGVLAGWACAPASAAVTGGVPVAELPTLPPPSSDTGLGQQLRQQLESGCFGFVEHDPGRVRGFDVDPAFQLQRDGYPWAQFEGGANLLIEREEVLVGGAGAACGHAPPGGTVNLVTRRDAGLPSRTVLEVGQRGGFSLLHEREAWVSPPRPGTRALGGTGGLAPVAPPAPAAEEGGEPLRARLALREERWPDPAGNRFDLSEAALQLDWRVDPAGLLRLDLGWLAGNLPSGAGWPAAEALPPRPDPRTSLEQPWSRYRFHQTSLLAAYERALGEQTRLRLGASRVHLGARWAEWYLEPLPGPAETAPARAAGPFQTFAYAVPRHESRFDGLQLDLSHGFDAGGARQQVFVALSRTRLDEPDDDFPEQPLGLWRPGEQVAAPLYLPPLAARCLVSQEQRLTLRHSAAWAQWQTQVGGVWSRTRDDNGTGRRQDLSFSPTASLTWRPSPAWRVQYTRSAGVTARQFASLSSATPAQIAAPGRSTEQELGLHWAGEGGWSAGAGVFELARPYRYERETVSVWRGRQTHQGVEAALGWANGQDTARLVFTAQALRARITRTGDPLLDGLQPPGVPERRASLLGEMPVPGAPAWSLSLLGEAVSRRPTFDDNLVFAAGYARWDLGLQWRGQVAGRNALVLLTLQNATGRRAWEDVGGGTAYALAPRQLALTLSLTDA